MTADRLILAILVAVGALALFLEPAAGWALQNILRPDESSALLAQMNLARENTALKTRIAESEALARTTAVLGDSAHVPVFVYSRYPFSFKNELLIAAGSENGLVVGVPVFLPVVSGASPSPDTVGTILIGKVKGVFKRTASVQTVFDIGFQMAVRIGAAGTDAVLSGGAEPQLTLIPKSSVVVPGEAVYAAAPDLPYGLPIGEVGALRMSANQLFQEAALALSYTGNDLKIVVVSATKN
ncbi:MAG: rod shape-determining protein MreC [Patescibacteria group bacterium]